MDKNFKINRSYWLTQRLSGFKGPMLIWHSSHSADCLPTSYLVSINMASILKFQSHDLKHGGTVKTLLNSTTTVNYGEDIIFSIKSLASLKDQVRRMVNSVFYPLKDKLIVLGDI